MFDPFFRQKQRDPFFGDIACLGPRFESRMEVPKIGVPKMGVPKMGVPKTEGSKMEVPKIGVPKMEGSKMEVPRIWVNFQTTQVLLNFVRQPYFRVFPDTRGCSKAPMSQASARATHRRGP